MKTEYRIQCLEDRLKHLGWIDDENLYNWIFDDLDCCLKEIEILKKEAKQDKNGFKYRIIERKFKDKILK